MSANYKLGRNHRGCLRNKIGAVKVVTNFIFKTYSLFINVEK